MNDDKWLELPEPAPHGCDCCDPTHASPDPVVVRLEREVELKGQDLMKVQKALVEALAHIDVLNFDLCQCRSELTTAREIAHRLGTERDDLVARRAEANAEVKRLTTAWRAIDRANVSLRERLAAAQTRNVCPECGLTPGAISTCYCEECVGEIKEKLAAAETEVENLRLQCAAFDYSLTQAEDSAAARMQERDECRRLLREACDECHVVDGVLVKGALTHRHSHNGARLPEEWFTEAAKAAGGGDDTSR